MSQKFTQEKTYWALGNENSINSLCDNWMDESPLDNKIRPNTNEHNNNQAKVYKFITTAKK